jgi:hypothetical protein
MFSRDLRDAVARGEITVSIRLWSRPHVKVGGRYPVAGVVIQIDSLEVLPFSAVTQDDVRASGEINQEALRARAATRGRSRTTPWSPGSSFTPCNCGGVNGTRRLAAVGRTSL